MPTPFSLYRRANSLQGPKLQFTSSVLIIHSTSQKLMNFRFLREKLCIVKRSCKNNWGSQDRILLNRKFLLSTLDWILGHFSLVPKNDKNYENFWSSVKTHFRPSDQKFDLVPKHTFDLVKFDLVVVSHKNVGTILCLAYIDKDLCNSKTFQYTVKAAWCDHFWLGYIW
jgi:hypothetical protein